MIPRISLAILRSRWKTSLLLLGICFFAFYGGLFYTLPAPGEPRNPADRILDSLGYSYHLVLFSFDIRQGSAINDYHARQALQYKPADQLLKQYIRNPS